MTARMLVRIDSERFDAFEATHALTYRWQFGRQHRWTEAMCQPGNTVDVQRSFDAYTRVQAVITAFRAAMSPRSNSAYKPPELCPASSTRARLSTPSSPAGRISSVASSAADRS